MHHFTMWVIPPQKKGIVSVNASGEKQNQEINGNHALPLHLSTMENQWNQWKSKICDVFFWFPQPLLGRAQANLRPGRHARWGRSCESW